MSDQVLQAPRSRLLSSALAGPIAVEAVRTALTAEQAEQRQHDPDQADDADDQRRPCQPEADGQGDRGLSGQRPDELQLDQRAEGRRRSGRAAQRPQNPSADPLSSRESFQSAQFALHAVARPRTILHGFRLHAPSPYFLRRMCFDAPMNVKPTLSSDPLGTRFGQ
ncbi:hypothetical protein [Methylorubrum aminovorans]|uniref:hypothetical protein n=1 Tax=Methylorubrum aminovorans TaxID=269069 RepID=UPI0024E08290|nr:hypothetical protein [Methylorubrum aminovorans]